MEFQGKIFWLNIKIGKFMTHLFIKLLLCYLPLHCRYYKFKSYQKYSVYFGKIQPYNSDTSHNFLYEYEHIHKWIKLIMELHSLLKMCTVHLRSRPIVFFFYNQGLRRRKTSLATLIKFCLKNKLKWAFRLSNFSGVI